MIDRPRRWLPRWLDPVALLVALLVALFVFTLFRFAAVDAQRSHDLTCIANYENANGARADVLTRLSTARSTALRREQDALQAVTTADANPQKSPPVRVHALLVVLDMAVREYQKADDVYNAALAANPLPPPVFTCSQHLPKPATANAPVPTPGTVTYTAVSVAPGSTVTRAYTVTIPQPGPTTTATQMIVTPGHGHDRIVTVTRTVSPPTCSLARPVPPCVLP